MNNRNTNPEQENAQETQLRELLQSHLPVGSPSQELQQRVAHLASQSASRTVASSSRPARTLRTPRWKFAASMGMCAALLLAGSVIWPRVLSTQALARVDLKQVDTALSQVSTVHSVRYRVEGTRRIKEGELWFDAGKWRVEGADGNSATVFANGTSWTYDKARNTVTVEKNSKGPFARNPTGFRLSNLVQDFGNPGSKTELTQQGTTTIDGRLMKRALLHNSNDYETSDVSLLVDAQTDLPQSLNMRVRTRYGKEGRWEMTFAYNQSLSPQLFKTDFGPSVRVVNSTRPVPATKQLATEIARKQLGNNTIIVRSLEVNSHGSVFLSYSVDGDAKDSNSEWMCFLGDSEVAQYHVEPLSSQEDQQALRQWWIPRQGVDLGQTWQPRTLQVRFNRVPRVREVGQSFVLDASNSVVFSLPVKAASATVLPPLMQQLSPDLSEEKVTEQEQAVQNPAASR